MIARVNLHSVTLYGLLLKHWKTYLTKTFRAKLLIFNPSNECVKFPQAPMWHLKTSWYWGHSNSLSGVLERVRALLDQTWVQYVQKVYRVGPHQLVHSCDRLGFAEPRNVPVLRFQCCESLLSICHRKTLQHLGKQGDTPHIYAVIAWDTYLDLKHCLQHTYSILQIIRSLCACNDL